MKIHKIHNKRALSRLVLPLTVLIFAGLIFFIANYYLGRWNADIDSRVSKISRSMLDRSILSAKEAKKKEPVYITLPGAKPIRAIVEDYTQADSIWVIVNKSNPISTDYEPVGIKIPSVPTRTDKSQAERSVRFDMEVPLVNMFSDAQKDGYSLMIGSGYRSAALQNVYFSSLANSVGTEVANQSIAYPGQSEHQTGLAVDISTVSRNCYIANCFEDTNEGQWLAKNSYKYGFILRYPKGKESITEYIYEPWHFRYVGIDLATALYESGVTLDEAWSYLKKANDTLRNNGALQ
jgi:D-alanyl-D-alanine carboxypeptidase